VAGLVNLAGLEWQAIPHDMFDAYYGRAYSSAIMASYRPRSSPAPDWADLVACFFGFPRSANSSHRAVQETAFGAIPPRWSNSTYGKLQVAVLFVLGLENCG
jgi:hypothetical protein